nr:aqualysin-1-like [Lytechinus pictus]
MLALMIFIYYFVHRSYTGGSAAPELYIAINYLVSYLQDGVDVGRFATSIKTGTVRKTLTGIINAVVLTLDDNLLDIVRGLNGVRYIEEDGLATVLGSREPDQYWGLDRIGQTNMPLDANINFSGTGTGANVFIVDTGIQYNHEDFDGRAHEFFDYETSGDGADCHGHGTHCAGTAGGTYSGVAVNTNLYSVRVMTCRGSGSYSNIIAGLNAVADSALTKKVASMSIGGGYSLALNNAVQSAVDNDVVVVVAAGNDNADACNYSPASAASCSSNSCIFTSFCLTWPEFELPTSRL